MLLIILSALLSLQTPVQPPNSRLAMPPSTMAHPIYVKLPITIEIANMSAQVVADLVASGKIALDGANHLNIPQGPMGAAFGPDMLRPSTRAQEIPPSSADQPIKLTSGQPLYVKAPIKFVVVTTGKTRLTVQGNRLVLTEIR